MSKEVFVRTKPHVNVRGGPDILNGASFRLSKKLDVKTSLTAHRPFQGSHTWTDYNLHDPGRRSLAEENGGVSLLARLSDNSGKETLLRFDLTGCIAIEYELTVNQMGDAIENLHFHCDPLPLN